MKDTLLYEIDFGYTQYWVLTGSPKDFLLVLQRGLEKLGEEMPASRFHARPLSRTEAATLAYTGINTTILDEMTRDSSSRLLGSSNSISKRIIEMEWLEQARKAVGLTGDVPPAKWRVLADTMPAVAVALREAFESGQTAARDQVRDFLDGKIQYPRPTATSEKE